MVFPLGAIDGELLPHNEMQIHGESLSMRYGLSVFEGVRGYLSERQTVEFFKLEEHLERLGKSAEGLGFQPIDLAHVRATASKLLEANAVGQDCYLRIAVNAKNQGTLANDMEASVFSSIRAMGRKKWLRDGVRQKVKISEHMRPNDKMLPQRLKCVANYAGARLALMDAMETGFDSVVMKNDSDMIAEGPTANIFFVKDAVVHTPDLDQCILNGITRGTILEICRELGIRRAEGQYRKEHLYECDEAFFCGTGLEIGPIAQFDTYRLPEANAITRQITDAFFRKVR